LRNRVWDERDGGGRFVGGSALTIIRQLIARLTEEIAWSAWRRSCAGDKFSNYRFNA